VKQPYLRARALVLILFLTLSVVILASNRNTPIVHGMAADCAVEPTGENYIGVRYKALLVEDKLSSTGWVLSFAGSGFTSNGEYEPHFMELMIKGGWADLYDDGFCANGFPHFPESRKNFTIHFQLSDYEDAAKQDNDIAARSRDPTLLPLFFTNIDSTDPKAPDMIAAEYQVDKGGTLEGREIDVSLERGDVTRLPIDENYFVDPDSGCKPNSQADIPYRQWIANLKVPSLAIDSSVDFYVNAAQGDKITGANTLNFMWENPGRPIIETDKFKIIVFDMEVKTTSSEWKRATKFLADYRTPRNELPLNDKGQLVGGYRKVNYNNQPAIELSFGYGYTDYVIDKDPTNYEPTSATKAVIDLGSWEGAFDYSLSSSGNINTSQGGTGSNKITVNLLSTSTEPVSLSCITTLPPGATCVFSTPSSSPPFDSTLSIGTSSSTPTGSYTVTILGEGDGVYRSGTFTLNVNPAQPVFDFSLSNSGGITVIQGDSGSNTITVNLLTGSPQPVTLSYVSGLPSGTSCSFNPLTDNPSFSSILTISSSSSTPAGSFNIVVKGSGAGVDKTTTFVLTVNPCAGTILGIDSLLFYVLMVASAVAIVAIVTVFLKKQRTKLPAR